jgi:hypothetical protein
MSTNDTTASSTVTTKKRKIRKPKGSLATRIAQQTKSDKLTYIPDMAIAYRVEHGVKVYDLGGKSLHEFIAYCKTRPTVSTGNITKLEALLRNGDPTAEADFEAYRANHRLRVESFALEAMYSVSGDFVDVGRYMTGEPECMVGFTGEQPVKFLTIRLRCAAQSGNYFAYYANICDLIDYLESRGTRCRIVAQMNHGNYMPFIDPETTQIQHDVTTRALCDVVIKEFSEPFDLRTFTAVFFHYPFSYMIYHCALSISKCKEMLGIDSQFTDGRCPDKFEQSPDTDEWITFPSLWYRGYSDPKLPGIDPTTFYRQIGILHLID